MSSTKSSKPLINIYYFESYGFLYLSFIKLCAKFDIYILPTSGTEMTIMVSEAY